MGQNFLTLKDPIPFVDPLSLYKHKDDLVILAGVLGLKTVGTVSELATVIKSHLS